MAFHSRDRLEVQLTNLCFLVQWLSLRVAFIGIVLSVINRDTAVTPYLPSAKILYAAAVTILCVFCIQWSITFYRTGSRDRKYTLHPPILSDIPVRSNVIRPTKTILGAYLTAGFAFVVIIAVTSGRIPQYSYIPALIVTALLCSHFSAVTQVDYS